MKLSRFNIPEEKRLYVTATKFPIEVKYKILNDQVILDIKELIDGILDENNIDKYETEKVEIRIPFDLNKVVTGNSIILGIDKKRYTIRIPSGKVIVSKQQKIDFDNTHPHRWKLPQWVKFIENLYYKYYGVHSLELSFDKSNIGKIRRGKACGMLNGIRKKVKAIKVRKMTDVDVLEYIDWVFSAKHEKVSISLAFLNSDSVIQDWLLNKCKNNKNKPADKKVRKWDA